VTDTLAAADDDGAGEEDAPDDDGWLRVLAGDACVEAPLQPDSIVTVATPSAAT